MDFGDLLFLFLIGFGILSSVFGDKKKAQKRAQQRARAAGARPQSAAPAGAPRRDPMEVQREMERILSDLGLASPEPPAPVEESPEATEFEPWAPPPPPVRHVDLPAPQPETAGGWEMARPAARTPPPAPAEVIRPDLRPLTAQTHEEFHRRFVQPLPEIVQHGSSGPSHRLFADRNRVRDAIIASEILGPPKSLR